MFKSTEVYQYLNGKIIYSRLQSLMMQDFFAAIKLIDLKIVTCVNNKNVKIFQHLKKICTLDYVMTICRGSKAFTYTHSSSAFYYTPSVQFFSQLTHCCLHFNQYNLHLNILYQKF